MSSHLSKTDTHLYRPSAPPPTKRSKTSPATSTPTPSSLTFTSTLSSLLSRPPSPPGPRASRAHAKKKDDIFTAHRLRRKDASSSRGKPGGEQDIGGVDEETLLRSRRRMEEKAKKYRAMKRGDIDVEEGGEGAGGLVEWDRKWTEAGEKGADDGEDDSEIEEGGGTFADLEKVEYEDEYGRLREGTKAERDRMHRRLRNQLRGAEELDRMSARPSQPESLIHGATVQSAAFNPDTEVSTQMEELARKRDRSATPPESVHYDAAKEVRSRGVGFYRFSREGRGGEMEGLEGLRRETVGRRGEDGGEDGGKGGGLVARMRARREAEVFLEGLEGGGGEGGEGGENGEGK